MLTKPRAQPVNVQNHGHTYKKRSFWKKKVTFPANLGYFFSEARKARNHSSTSILCLPRQKLISITMTTTVHGLGIHFFRLGKKNIYIIIFPAILGYFSLFSFWKKKKL